MKIAFVDNMNNNFFAFSRYLRDCGVEAFLYETPCAAGLDHFKPEADTFLMSETRSWIKEFPVKLSLKSWVCFNKKAIKEEFDSYDLIIGCGQSCAYLCRAGLTPDITIPYGSDMYQLPFVEIVPRIGKAGILSLISYWLGHWQKKALKETPVLVSDPQCQTYRDALEKLEVKAHNWGVPMLYNQENLDTPENREIWGFLNGHDFIVFNHSRQWWKTQVDPELRNFDKYGGAKRNDKLVRAFASFAKLASFKKPVLVLFDYGRDVDETKKLIAELEVGHLVKWMPTMKRKNIMYGLQKATFSTNAFREKNLDIGGVCYETLAVGTPHLNNCLEAIESSEHKFFKSPMLHAVSEEDIFHIFKDYEENPAKFSLIKDQSKRWFDENLGKGLAARYLRLCQFLVASKARNSFWSKTEKIMCE